MTRKSLNLEKEEDVRYLAKRAGTAVTKIIFEGNLFFAGPELDRLRRKHGKEIRGNYQSILEETLESDRPLRNNLSLFSRKDAANIVELATHRVALDGSEYGDAMWQVIEDKDYKSYRQLPTAGSLVKLLERYITRNELTKLFDSAQQPIGVAELESRGRYI